MTSTNAHGLETNARTSARRWRLVVFLLFAGAFLFRLGYGLCSDFADDDSVQIYLLGLKFYTTGWWPFFGPDALFGVAQIPGALQGLLVGGPFYFLPIPEAPYVLLNLLSFLALCLLGWYALKRLPEMPAWLVWPWIFTCPWALNLSTNIYNPSYMLAGSVVFFVGMLEVFTPTRLGVIERRWAAAMMGFGIGWTMQIHMSWVLLPPFAVVALFTSVVYERRSLSLVFFALGFLSTASLVIPTYIAYGGSGNTESLIGFNADNLTALFGIVRRVISLGSFDVSNYLGRHTADRLAFFAAEPWTVPAVVVCTVIGVAQGVAMVVFWFRDRDRPAEWKGVKYLFLFSLVLVYASFLMSAKPPQSNHVFVIFPLVMIYSLYCWEPLLKKLLWQRVAAVLVMGGVIVHLGLAAYNLPRISLYTMRERVATAIQQRDYTALAERRPGSKY